MQGAFKKHVDISIKTETYLKILRFPYLWNSTISNMAAKTRKNMAAKYNFRESYVRILIDGHLKFEFIAQQYRES